MTTTEAVGKATTIETIGRNPRDTNQVELVGTTYSRPRRKRFGGTTLMVGTEIGRDSVAVHIPDVSDAMYARLQTEIDIPIRIVGQLGGIGRTGLPVVVARQVTLDPIDTAPRNRARLVGRASSTKVWSWGAKGLVSMFVTGGDASADGSIWDCRRPMFYTETERHPQKDLELVEGERIFVEGYVGGWAFGNRDGSVLEACTISIIDEGAEDSGVPASTNP